MAKKSRKIHGKTKISRFLSSWTLAFSREFPYKRLVPMWGPVGSGCGCGSGCSQPILQLLPILLTLHMFLTPATTYSDPCFLFFEPNSPPEFQIRIKRRELVLKAARIYNFVAPPPHWGKIKAKFCPNRELLALHCHLVFAKNKMRI